MAIAHGGRLDAAMEIYGGSREDWIDLSTGINPNPYPVPEVELDAWSSLPDEHGEAELIAAARIFYKASDEQRIAIANGTQAIIQRLPDLLGRGRVGIVSPTYGEHAHVWQRAGAEVVEVESADAIPNGLDVLVIVNPNNPDCRLWRPEQLGKIADKVGTLISDEAFCDPVPEYSIVPNLPDNAIVLKSFGKFFGLAGARLGFAICKPQWTLALQDALGPWSVSGPALKIGAKALADADWISNTCNDLKNKSRQLAKTLEYFQFSVEGVNPLFVYASHSKAKALTEHLARNHILVRAFEDKPQHLRFGLCKDEGDLLRLKEALAGFEDG